MYRIVKENWGVYLVCKGDMQVSCGVCIRVRGHLAVAVTVDVGVGVLRDVISSGTFIIGHKVCTPRPSAPPTPSLHESTSHGRHTNRPRPQAHTHVLVLGCGRHNTCALCIVI